MLTTMLQRPRAEHSAGAAGWLGSYLVRSTVHLHGDAGAHCNACPHTCMSCCQCWTCLTCKSGPLDRGKLSTMPSANCSFKNRLPEYYFDKFRTPTLPEPIRETPTSYNCQILFCRAVREPSVSKNCQILFGPPVWEHIGVVQHSNTIPLQGSELVVQTIK